MRKYIGSSRNAGRMPGAVLDKEQKVRKVRSRSSLRTYKASEFYTNLYGRKAYEDWKARECEIDFLMKDRTHYSPGAIIEMRKENFRKMKASERIAPDASPDIQEWIAA